jgi:hypothetical protein
VIRRAAGWALHAIALVHAGVGIAALGGGCAEGDSSTCRCRLGGRASRKVVEPDALQSRNRRLFRRIIDLELVSGVGDEDDEQLRGFRPTGVFREHVVGARLLGPVFALAVGTPWPPSSLLATVPSST